MTTNERANKPFTISECAVQTPNQSTIIEAIEKFLGTQKEMSVIHQVVETTLTWLIFGT